MRPCIRRKPYMRHVFAYKDPSAIIHPQLEGFREQGDVISIGNLDAERW